MAALRGRRCRKYSTVVGSIFLLAPNGLFWYWGNLSVYSLSYLVFACDVISNVATPWIISAFFVFWTFTVILSAMLANCIGRRCTIFLGAVLTDMSFFLSYFSVHHSVFALTLTMGVLMGTGTGLTDSAALQCVIEWADRDTGRLTAAVQASLALGGFVINELITFYINPQNLIPDIAIGKTKYFSQTEVLSRVPPLYIILGSLSFGLHLMGFLLLQPVSSKEEGSYTDLQSDATDVNIKPESQDEREGKRNYLVGKENGTVITSTKATPDDKHPKEMLKTISFWALWLTFFMGSLSVVLVTNYYKSFGILWIDDDHFLTDLGTMIMFSSAIMGFSWGFIMDNVGIKHSLIISQFLLTLTQVWFYFSAMPNKWLYFIVTLLMGSLAGTTFSCYTAATAVMFGKSHFTSNFGIVMTSCLIFNILAPPVMEMILIRLGWFALFAIAGFLNLVRLVLVLLFIPDI